jgi:hypothetical protein
MLINEKKENRKKKEKKKQEKKEKKKQKKVRCTTLTHCVTAGVCPSPCHCCVGPAHCKQTPD